jgi:hypothetical protein
LQQPLLESAFTLGVASAGLHARHIMTLGNDWVALSLFSTLPVVALLAVHLRAGRVVVQPRG